MRIFYFILIGISSLIGGNFSRANGVVHDYVQVLEWQDDYSDNNNDIKNTTWQSAIDYCENLNLNGISNWRLPNLNELSSLIDDQRYDVALNPIFEQTSADFYWSSTSRVDHKLNAWVVNFTAGLQSNYDKAGNSHYVRCVSVVE